MKNISFLFAITYLLLLCACGSPCDDIICGANGVCLEGVCDCDEGYEGENCETELRAKFVGEWIADDYGCNGANGVSYGFEIVRGATVNDLVFKGEGSTIEFPATYSGNVMTIPLKEYGTTTLMGTLTLNSNDILQLDFEIDNSITILDCSANAVRK